MSDRKAELTLSLNGLSSMEAAREILYGLEEGVTAEGSPAGAHAVNIDRETYQEIERMRNEIERSGAGLEFYVEAELRASQGEEE